MPDQHLHTRKEVPQGNETARKVEVEPVLDNADQWQEAEEEVDNVVFDEGKVFPFLWGGRGETGSSHGQRLGYQISLGIKNTRREEWDDLQERMRGLAIEGGGKQWAGAEVIYQANGWGHGNVGQHPWISAPSTQRSASNISRIRIRDKTGETWYSGDASC